MAVGGEIIAEMDDGLPVYQHQSLYHHDMGRRHHCGKTRRQRADEADEN